LTFIMIIMVISPIKIITLLRGNQVGSQLDRVS
jgi:hypothetical protein